MSILFSIFAVEMMRAAAHCKAHQLNKQPNPQDPEGRKEKMEQKERLRKEYAKNGSQQKMMTFRADVDVVAILANVANKGRLLNNLVKEWAAAHRSMAVEHDDAPEVYDIPLNDEL